jgi:hypothetical protein
MKTLSISRNSSSTIGKFNTYQLTFRFITPTLITRHLDIPRINYIQYCQLITTTVIVTTTFSFLIDIVHSELLGFWTLLIVRYSKHFWFLEYRTMHEVQKPNNSESFVYTIVRTLYNLLDIVHVSSLRCRK